MAKRAARYTVSDGKMTLVLKPGGDGIYTVTCPAVKGLVTEARTIEDAFAMARDARRGLLAARRLLAKRR